MSAFRHCCRQPRTSSPGLPSAQLVPDPTQDDTYDADAVLIPAPTASLIRSISPLELNEPRLAEPNEPRPSSDTIVYHEVVQRVGSKIEEIDEEATDPADTNTLEVQRISPIYIPRRRSHASLQSLPSPSAAALDNYVKISPSRAALRKRLESVRVVDIPRKPPSPTLEPARVASIPESAISPKWRLSYNEKSSGFRRSGLQEVDVIEHRKNDGLPLSNRSRTQDQGQKDEQKERSEEEHVSVESTRHASSATTDLTHNVPTIPTEYRRMPGNHHSESTEVSVHLYDMHISERVASSNSNIVSMGELSLSRRASGMSRYRRSRKSSTLQSPKPSSSIYSSNEEDLASSRRSSMKLFDELPDRIRLLKSQVTAGDLYSTSTQHSLITIVPRSRLPTTLSDEDTQDAHSEKFLLASQERLGQERLKENKPQSPPLRRSSTEPRLNRFKRGAPASFDGSGEWHLSPPPAAPTGRIQRQATSLLYPESVESAWEKALRDHATEDAAISKSRIGSISYDIGRDDFKRRARSRKFTRTSSPLGNITEDAWSQARGREGGPASGRVSPTQMDLGSVAAGSPVPRPTSQPRSRAASSSTRSADSWTRYPSHTYVERTEAANAKDNVITRDFAIGSPVQTKGSKKQSRTMTLGRMFHKIGQLYKARSSDFRRYHAGHRSSISVGGRLEYPELEMPRSSFEPVLLSGPRDDQMDKASEGQANLIEAVAAPLPSSPRLRPSEEGQRPRDSPRTRPDKIDWAREFKYDECVAHPRVPSAEEEIAPDEMVPASAAVLELDAVMQVEVDKAKEDVLRAAEECLKRSMEIDRFPKRL
ncbi:MAG: hypothetical protein LQ350_002727 [Teloschistes chrysophthalmus]|nr:MAG: hypothetical protein LQ350_002727 [Niorma chrysophthalma]